MTKNTWMQGRVYEMEKVRRRWADEEAHSKENTGIFEMKPLILTSQIQQNSWMKERKKEERTLSLVLLEIEKKRPFSHVISLLIRLLSLMSRRSLSFEQLFLPSDPVIFQKVKGRNASHEPWIRKENFSKVVTVNSRKWSCSLQERHFLHNCWE